MFHRTRLGFVVLTAAFCSFAAALSSLASPIDLPCELGPFLSSPGTVGAGTNGPAGTGGGPPGETDMEAWRRVILDTTDYASDGVFALNAVDGFSHGHRVFAGINFTLYEFDEFDGEAIDRISADVLTLEAGVQVGKNQKRATRIGIRVPYVDYHDSDSTDPSSASDFFDAEIFADIGFSWDDDDESDNRFLTGMLLETRLTLPTGDEDVYLGREDVTLGVRPRWFLRWTPNEVEVDVNDVPVARGDGPRLTQVHVSAGLGYVWDLGVSENSYWSPAVGLLLGWSDRVFLELEVQAELHDSGLDQYDWLTRFSFRLLPEDGRRQVFLSVGAIVALNDEGLRDRIAPTAGVSFAFGQIPPRARLR